MKDIVDAPRRSIEGGRVTQVHLPKIDLRQYRLKIHTLASSKVVNAPHGFAPGNQGVGERRADEAGDSSDQVLGQTCNTPL
jgi:hypothetical protein